MSVAMDIMLERLKTHPEEFVSLMEDVSMHGKWYPLLQSLNDWATPEEIQSLQDGLMQAKKLLADQTALQILSGEYYSTPQVKMAYQDPNPYGKTMTAEELSKNTLEEYKQEMRRMMAEQRLLRAKGI